MSKSTLCQVTSNSKIKKLSAAEATTLKRGWLRCTISAQLEPSSTPTVHLPTSSALYKKKEGWKSSFKGISSDEAVFRTPPIGEEEYFIYFVPSYSVEDARTFTLSTQLWLLIICGDINATFSRPCFLETVLSYPFLTCSFSCP